MKIDLSKINTEASREIDKGEYKDKTEALKKEIAELQEKLYAQNYC